MAPSSWAGETWRESGEVSFDVVLISYMLQKQTVAIQKFHEKLSQFEF